MKIDRLIGIVTILLQTEKSTVPALAQRFEVSRRTIERDIDALCRAGVPLVTVQGYGGGVFIEPRYKLDKTLLSGPELAALVAGAAGVGSVSPAPLARSLAEKLGGSGTDDLLIDLSSHYRESLTPKIELLRTAIAEHARVRFTYYYAKGVAEKCAEPYRIVFQWGDWYMFGWCPDAAGWRMYKLNRLTLLSVTAQTFEPRAIPPEALDFNAASTTAHCCAPASRPANATASWRSTARPAIPASRTEACCWRSATPTKTSRQPGCWGSGQRPKCWNRPRCGRAWRPRRRLCARYMARQKNKNTGTRHADVVSLCL